MQRSGPSHLGLAESEALGDAEQPGRPAATRDPLTGEMSDALAIDPAAEDAAATARLREFGCGPAEDAEASEALAAQILAEKHARGLHGRVNIDGCPACEAARPVELKAEDQPAEPPMAERLQKLGVELLATAEWPLLMLVSRIGTAAVDLEPYPTEEEIAAEAERIWRSFDENRTTPKALAVDVAADGTVAGVRPAAMTPDRGEGVGVTHHTVSDDDVPFSEPSRLIPSDGAFLNAPQKDAPELANLAARLIEQHGFLARLGTCRIDYLWERKGSNSKGKRSIGRLKRVSGTWRRYCPFQFVISLSADTARLAAFTDRQVEAALFHQLLHIDQDAKGNWIRVGHDFEGFGTEVRHYGPWTEDLKIGSQSFATATQLGLDLDADEEDDEEDEDSDVASGAAYYAEDQPPVAAWERYRTTADAASSEEIADEVIRELDEDEPADPDRPYEDEADDPLTDIDL
jgi:hypothetical protein